MLYSCVKMSQDAIDRVGARPLNAFHTADICPEAASSSQQQQEQQQGDTSSSIGITPLVRGAASMLSEEEEEDDDDDPLTLQQSSSILMSQEDDVFGLLQDPHNADPPIISSMDDGDSSEDEYHSPLEDNDEEQKMPPSAKPIMNASPYDYDVNWDMVGHLRQEESRDPETLNTCLAEAAAASMIAKSVNAAAATMTPAAPSTTTIPDEQPPLPPQPFTFRRTSSRNSYRYQKYSNQDEQQDPHIGDSIMDDLETASVEDLVLPMEENEIHDSANSTSSSSTSSSMTHRRRRRHARAASFHASPTRTTTTILRPPVVPEEDYSSSRSYSSLDSGMAAVRRWIRARTALSSGGVSSSSSRAARRWQREAAAAAASSMPLQLGEEDLFALTHAGQDPRLPRDFSIILEEEDDVVVGGGAVRQRALSEPNNIRMRNFFFQRAAHGPSPSVISNSSMTSRSYSNNNNRRRQESSQSLDEDASIRSGSAAAAAALTTSISVPTHLSSAALNSSLFHSPQRGTSGVSEEVMTAEQRAIMNDGDVSSLAETSVPPSTISMLSPASAPDDEDPNREARTRWIRINRRFQLIITVVALIFSLLLFAIMVCWVVFTSAYVVSIDKQCDVPLKQYFWLATLQLILDVFRTDIMRFIFRWDTHSNDRIPVRVIMYNIAYLIYALLVLRMGIRGVFKADDSTCPSTAPELYRSAAVFVSLSLAAWSTIVLGYLVPFCFVATLLTWNGYTPTAESQEQNATAFIGGVFPAAYSTTGAPPGCVDQLRTVLLEEFPDDYPRECCICMGDFVTGEVIVATECQHVFHKRCCEEWLRQARTCPVCRMDIPSSLNPSSETEPEQPPPPASRLTHPFPGREDIHQDVVGLLQILRRQEPRLRQRNSSSDAADPTGEGLHVSSSSHDASPQAVARSESLPVRGGETEMVALEEGRVNRQHSN